MSNNFLFHSLALPALLTSNIIYNMTRKKNPLPHRPGFLQCLMVAMLFFTGQKSFSQFHRTDTSQRELLASVDKRATANYFVKECNVVFPEILKGNEEEATDYIEKFCAKRKEYIIRMHTRGKKLLPKAAAILKKHNLPEELKVLLTLESAYNGNAVSSAGAVGYWQFMDVVAKEYGLKYVPHEKKEEKKKIVNGKGKKGIQATKADKKETAKLKDERKNFNKATIAAARYLRDRRVNLDDNWLLVVASYNCGVGNVWSAMEKSGRANPTFWDIKKYLPAETKAYVMNFITLNVIFANYDQFTKNNLIFKPVRIELRDNFEQPMQDAMDELEDSRLR